MTVPVLERSTTKFKAWEGFLWLPQSFWNLFFALLVLFGQVGQNVTLPIWFASVPQPNDNELDPLFVLTFAGLAFVVVFSAFWMLDLWNGDTTIAEARFYLQWRYLRRYVMVGASNGVGGMMLVFAAARCAPFFQAILGTFNILWTIILRALYLKHYPSLKQGCYAALVYLGLFVTVVPSLLGLETGGAFETEGNGVWKLLWPMLFAAAYIPFAWMNVVGEEVLKESAEDKSRLLPRSHRLHTDNVFVAHSFSAIDECEEFSPSELTDDGGWNVSKHRLGTGSVDMAQSFPVFPPSDVCEAVVVSSADQTDDDWKHDAEWRSLGTELRQKRRMSVLSSMVGDPYSIADSSVNLWYYLMWTSVFQECLFVALFWVDCLPTVGTTQHAWNLKEIFTNQRQDWLWLFGMDGASLACTIRALVFVGCYTLTNLGYALMLRYTDGATWIALIGSVVTPAGGIFWLLCTLDDNKFAFEPEWHSWSLFIFAGLFLMCPSIYYYDKACEAPDVDSASSEAPVASTLK